MCVYLCVRVCVCVYVCVCVCVLGYVCICIIGNLHILDVAATCGLPCVHAQYPLCICIFINKFVVYVNEYEYMCVCVCACM